MIFKLDINLEYVELDSVLYQKFMEIKEDKKKKIVLIHEILPHELIRDFKKQ